MLSNAMQSGQHNGYSLSLNKIGDIIAIGTPGDVLLLDPYRQDYRFGNVYGLLDTNAWGESGISAANANRWNPGYVRIFKYNSQSDIWEQKGNTIVTNKNLINAKLIGLSVSLDDTGDNVAFIVGGEFTSHQITTFVYEYDNDNNLDTKGNYMNEGGSYTNDDGWEMFI